MRKKGGATLSFPDWRRLAESVTVEPVLVLFSLSQGIYMITAQTVYIDKARHLFPGLMHIEHDAACYNVQPPAGVQSAVFQRKRVM